MKTESIHNKKLIISFLLNIFLIILVLYVYLTFSNYRKYINQEYFHLFQATQKVDSYKNAKERVEIDKELLEKEKRAVSEQIKNMSPLYDGEFKYFSYDCHQDYELYEKKLEQEPIFHFKLPAEVKIEDKNEFSLQLNDYILFKLEASCPVGMNFPNPNYSLVEEECSLGLGENYNAQKSLTSSGLDVLYCASAEEANYFKYFYIIVYTQEGHRLILNGHCLNTKDSDNFISDLAKSIYYSY